MALHLKELASHLEVIPYAHVYKELNTLAHSLSKEGLIQHQDLITEVEFPEGTSESSRTIHLHDF